MSIIPNVTVPLGVKGAWAVDQFEVSKKDADFNNMRAAFGSSARFIKPGIYTRLTRNGKTIMSDTPAEKRDHWWPVDRAEGHCLVNGLGLGMVVNAMLLKEQVTKVTVVELSQDVIDLVAPHYLAQYGDRLEIVKADAFTYQPAAARYGVVWHDIWDDICTDNLPQMTKLKRKYGRRAEKQGCWCESEVRDYARRGR